MAALEFQPGHDNRVAQVLAIPPVSQVFGCASADQRLNVQISPTNGYNTWGNIGFNQSLCLSFQKAAVSYIQRVQLLLATHVANDDGQETEYFLARSARITWYCCNCGHSHVLETPRCVNCNHIRCGGCVVE